jgi:ATP-binding cassette subfamily G (WHITE) protein 2
VNGPFQHSPASQLRVAAYVCAGGFFLSPAHTPVYWRWLDSLSYVKWTYVGISLNELTGLVLTCSPAELEKAGGKCPVTSGEQTISQLGLGQYSIGLCAGILVVYIFVCRFAAYLGLRLRKW